MLQTSPPGWHQERLQISSSPGIACQDITTDLNRCIERLAIRSGLMQAAGQHTTTALLVNEAEERLMADLVDMLRELVPPDRPYRHNDLHLRSNIPADEPRNAHSHLLAMRLGNHLSIPIVDGRLALGRYQSVLFVELDGPRQRQVLLQIIGL